MFKASTVELGSLCRLGSSGCGYWYQALWLLTAPALNPTELLMVQFLQQAIRLVSDCCPGEIITINMIIVIICIHPVLNRAFFFFF